MNDFDDEQLRNEFDRRAGRGVAVAAAHDAVLARAGLVRRRRVAVAGSGALIVLVVGGLVLLPGGDGDSRAPADSGQPIPSVEDDIVIDDLPTSTTAPGPDHSEVDDGAVPPPPTDSTASTDSSVRASTTVPAVAATTSNTPPPTTTTAPTTTAPSAGSSATTTVGTSGSSSSSSSAPDPALAPFTESYDSAGGSITVTWDGASFSLLSVAPASGFESEIEDQRATRLRVRFRGDDDDSRIEVRVENGLLTVDIS